MWNRASPQEPARAWRGQGQTERFLPQKGWRDREQEMGEEGRKGEERRCERLESCVLGGPRRQQAR